MSGSEGPYLVDVIEATCVHPVGPKRGDPLILEGWQKEFLHEAERFDDNGDYIYRSVLFSGPRNIAKSTLAAARGLMATAPLSGINGPRVVAAATTRDQAKIIWGHAKTMAELSPELGAIFKSSQNSIWCEENAGQFVRISAEGSAEMGHMRTFIFKDELAWWETIAQSDLNTALNTAMVKNAECRMWAVSTMGYDKDTILGRLYDHAVKLEDVTVDGGLTVAKDEKAGFLMWSYAAPEDADVKSPKVWRMANPASWTTDEMLENQYNDPEIHISEFRRQHLNQWTAALDLWIQPMGLWESLASKTDFPEKAKLAVAVDASLSEDSTAVSWAYQPDDGPCIVRAHIFSAVPSADFHTFCPGGFIDYGMVEDFIIGLSKKHPIAEIAYDPRFFVQSAQKLEGLGFRDTFPMHPGSVPMDDAHQAFFAGCKGRQITHDGDQFVANHVNATSGVKTERGWRVRKLGNGKIDATVAICMAHARAKHLASEGAYDTYFI